MTGVQTCALPIFNSGNPATGLNPQATFDSDWVTQTGGVFFYSLIATGSGNFIISNFGQDSSFAGNKTAQGNADGRGIGDFYYEPPTGFLALCTQNLPEPTVVPSEHFNTVLYTGDAGNLAQSITGVGFQPDLLWIKSRVTGYGHALQDVVRGATSRLQSNTTGAEATSATYVTSFDTDGFSVSTDYGQNAPNEPYASWNWKANGAGVSNTNGTITSTVSANVDAGFSIVSYTGTGVVATVGHGLSSAPELIHVKERNSTSGWITYNKTILATKYLSLSSTMAAAANTSVWNNTTPTSTVFSLGTNLATNESARPIIAYCFHSVEGYSKVGSYTGNGSADGTFVHCGFRPAYVMVKGSSVAGSSWIVIDSTRDSYNVASQYLHPNLSNAEGSTPLLDFTSNGFKWRYSGASGNTSGGTYIFLAFAENPFKYTNAR